MEEKWKKVQEFPNYSVSTEGRLRNDVTKHIRNFDEQKPYNRYAVASFQVDGKPVRRKLHCLVAKAWMDNPNNLPEYLALLLADKKTFGIDESNIGIPLTKFNFFGSDLIIILSKESPGH